MTGDRGARFIAAFNEMEEIFRSVLNEGTHVEFKKLARDYADKNRLLREQKNDLIVFADLRNAISHMRYCEGRPIAEPAECVVERIEKFLDYVKSPPSALGAVGHKDVKVLSPADPIDRALNFIRSDGYSQFPVYENGKYCGLLTTNTISMWLASQWEAHGGLAESEEISRVLEFAEPHESAVLLSRVSTAADALYKLTSSGINAKPVTALLITETGKGHEKPLTIIVSEDIPNLARAVLSK